MKTLVLTFLAGLLQVPLSSPEGDKKQIRHYFMAALSLLMMYQGKNPIFVFKSCCQDIRT